MGNDDAYQLDITDDQLLLLSTALTLWDGPALVQDLVGPVVWTTSRDEFHHLTGRLRAVIETRGWITPFDFTRAMVLTEICWASELLGAASHFQPIIGDERALAALRSLQREPDAPLECEFGFLTKNLLLPEYDGLTGLRPMTRASDVFTVDLTDERRMLLDGVTGYGFTASDMTFAVSLIGGSAEDDVSELERVLHDAIKNGEPLSEVDWVRALALTEIFWASNNLGGAWDFEIANMGDQRALPAMRSLQSKLVTERRKELLIGYARPLRMRPARPHPGHRLGSVVQDSDVVD